MTVEADHLYRPLDGLERWRGVAVDEAAWAAGIGRLGAGREADPHAADMADRGVRLAAAYASAACSDQVHREAGLVRALVSGARSLASLPAGTRAHVAANYEAAERAVAGIAGHGDPELLLREVHALACHPQVHHRVMTAIGEQDHVLAHGEYKHHPNHAHRADGSWRAFTPVDQLPAEMARLTAALAGPTFAMVHPVVRAAFVLHALGHVGPFAAGNGRTARALASAHLIRAGAPPLVVPAAGWEDADGSDPAVVVGVVARLFEATVDRVAQARAEQDTGAVAAWRGRLAAGAELGGQLPSAFDAALRRHRGRPGVAWQSDLRDVHVRPGNPLVIRVALSDGTAVEEQIAVDPNPVDGAGGTVALVAAGAGLRLDLSTGDGDGSGAVAPWLDRVTTALAVRVAAALE